MQVGQFQEGRAEEVEGVGKRVLVLTEASEVEGEVGEVSESGDRGDQVVDAKGTDVVALEIYIEGFERFE